MSRPLLYQAFTMLWSQTVLSKQTMKMKIRMILRFELDLVLSTWLPIDGLIRCVCHKQEIKGPMILESYVLTNLLNSEL